jgi:hypothetical protein
MCYGRHCVMVAVDGVPMHGMTIHHWLSRVSGYLRMSWMVCIRVRWGRILIGDMRRILGVCDMRWELFMVVLSDDWACGMVDLLTGTIRVKRHVAVWWLTKLLDQDKKRSQI